MADSATGVPAHGLTRSVSPLDDDTRETVERALKLFCAGLGELVGNCDAVSLLDSGGGAYPFVAPSVTAPICEHFPDDSGRIFDELCSRFNSWCESAFESLCERIDDADDVIEPDYVIHKNRQYRAPLSIHKSMDAVVHPMDTTAPSHERVRVGDVDSELVESCEQWCRSLTENDYSGGVDSLIAELFADEHASASSWQEALRAWLDEQDARAATR